LSDHLARRVQLACRRIGLDADAAWIDRPSYCHLSWEKVVETRVRSEGLTYVMHHSAHGPNKDRTLRNIMEVMAIPPHGVELAEIQRLRSRLRHALRPDGYSVVTRTPGSGTYEVQIPTTMLDILGRPHDRIARCPVDPMEAYGTHMTAETLRKLDKGRRSANGRPRAIMIGGGLVQVLKHHPHGRILARDLMPALERALERAEVGSSSGVVGGVLGVTQLGTTLDHDVKIVLKNGTVQIRDHHARTCTLSGDLVSTTAELPAQILAACRGRGIGTVVEGAPVDPATPIREAYMRAKPRRGAVFRLDVAAMPYADLMDELANGN